MNYVQSVRNNKSGMNYVQSVRLRLRKVYSATAAATFISFQAEGNHLKDTFTKDFERFIKMYIGF